MTAEKLLAGSRGRVKGGKGADLILPQSMVDTIAGAAPDTLSNVVAMAEARFLPRAIVKWLHFYREVFLGLNQDQGFKSFLQQIHGDVKWSDGFLSK